MFKWHVAPVRQIRAHVRSGIHSVEVFRLFHIALGKGAQVQSQPSLGASCFWTENLNANKG